MRDFLRKGIMAALTVFPSRIKILIYRHVLHFDIADDVHIGLSLILCRNVILGSGAVIGHMNVIRGNMTLDMKVRSSIGQFNWITAGNADPRYFEDCDRQSELIIGEESSITSRHILDCTDSIAIGRLTTLAGYRSTILTHSIDYRTAKQTCRPIRIGDFCLIGSNVTVLMGVTIANRNVIGAGTIVAKSIEREQGVWVGAPARLTKELSGKEHYFTRQIGHIN
jgi:acetyltransferase-like isoleucine patch superfamily enzyme